MEESYRINLDDAVKLIQAFVTDPSLGKIARNDALGATINPGSIFGLQESIGFVKSNFVELYNGHMAWFCSNDFGLNEYPKLFLAYEQNDSYQKGDEVAFPDMRKLKCPSEVFIIPQNVPNLDQWLADHTIDPRRLPNQYVDKVIDRSMVMQFASNFKQSNLFGGFNKFSFSFFENEKSMDVNAFLKTPGLTYIRYYFGYDNAQKYDTSNHIRIILIAVDINGKNIVTNKRDSDVVMLQHSWPPPPPVQ